VESFVDADLREHRQWTLPAIDVPCSNQNKPVGYSWHLLYGGAARWILYRGCHRDSAYHLYV